VSRYDCLKVKDMGNGAYSWALFVGFASDVVVSQRSSSFLGQVLRSSAWYCSIRCPCLHGVRRFCRCSRPAWYLSGSSGGQSRHS
jgi:hypothetical protein